MKQIIQTLQFPLVMLMAAILLLSSCGKKNDIIPTPTPTPVVTPPVTTPIVSVPSKELGWGCDLTKGYPSPDCVTFRVINVDALNALSSDRVVISQLEGNDAISIASENIVNFSKTISAKITASAFMGLFKSSASFFDSTAMHSDVIVAVYDMQVFKARLRFNASIELLKQYLTPEFKADIATQSPAFIVSHYGTHCFSDIRRGAVLNIAYRARTSSVDKKSAASAGLSLAVKNVFDLSISPGVNASYAQTNTDQYLDYKTIGGNSSIALIGELTLGATVPNKIQIAAWQNSISGDNAELIDLGSPDGLIDLSDLVADPAKAAALKAYIHQYLLAHQVTAVDPPSAVYQYYDAVNVDFAYSLDNVPALYGRFYQPTPTFRAWSTQMDSSVPVYKFYSAANADFILTTNAKFSSGDYTSMGLAFYAYSKQQPGTVPCFEYLYNAKIHKNIYYTHFYSTSNGLPGNQDWAYTGQPFYVYPL